MMQRPLKVLMTTPNLGTAGMRYVVSDLIKRFDRSLIQPSLCVHSKKKNELEKEALSLVEHFHQIKLRIPVKPLTTLMKRVAEAAEPLRGKFDVMHSFDYASSWTEGLVAKHLGIPWIVEKTDITWDGYRWWLRSFLADKIICLSYAQQTEIFKGTIYQSKTEVIHTGVDLKKFSDSKIDRKEMRCSLELPPDAFILGCIADILPVKGQLELCSAFSRLIQEKQNAYLLLVGHVEEAYGSKIKDFLSSKGITGRVKLLGCSENIPGILKALDGFVLPTRSFGRKESFGAAIIEAMASGLAVIATQSGGPSEIVVQGKTGWLVSAEGDAPLEKAMREMMGDDQRRKQYGKEGRRIVEEKFSAESMAQNYQEMYLRFMKQRAISRKGNDPVCAAS